MATKLFPDLAPGVGMGTRETLEEDDAGGIEVGAMIARARQDTLGSDITRCSDDDAGRGERGDR